MLSLAAALSYEAAVAAPLSTRDTILTRWQGQMLLDGLRSPEKI